ncbi:gluconokinase, GntK/IdnK-type [Aquipuribacter nitratireducens]|uniref:Gluconokinase n=1 Tax=Aquipuribacter nitratireducens TaxID=650104 RepID=A0ABW0GJX6_9MICO
MGVSGSGKTSVAHALVDRLGWDFLEGDDAHPAANVEKMRAGTPLTDDDRWGWLRTIAHWVGTHHEEGRRTVVACSALRRAYRDVLRTGDEEAVAATAFVHLHGDRDLLLSRISGRKGHFMPATLLDSQLDTLEPLGGDERGVVIDVDDPPDVLAERVVEALGLRPGPPGLDG